MGKKVTLLLGLIFLLGIAFVMSNSVSLSEKAIAEVDPINFSLPDNGAVWLDANPYRAFTVGNHSYITLNSCDDPGQYRSLFDPSGVYPPHYIISAFEALVAFEKAHMELHVTRWEMEINKPSHYDRSGNELSSQLSCLRGIIIDHEPRK